MEAQIQRDPDKPLLTCKTIASQAPRRRLLVICGVTVEVPPTAIFARAAQVPKTPIFGQNMIDTPRLLLSLVAALFAANLPASAQQMNEKDPPCDAGTTLELTTCFAKARETAEAHHRTCENQHAEICRRQMREVRLPDGSVNTNRGAKAGQPISLDKTAACLACRATNSRITPIEKRPPPNSARSCAITGTSRTETLCGSAGVIRMNPRS
jgi:hypothetical protein